MKKSVLLNKKSVRNLVISVCVVALAAALLVALPQPAHADDIVLPPIPGNLQVPAGNRVFLEGHATGTQNYICMSSSSGIAWTFYGPQATLFDDFNEQTITHFLSPNPVEGATARPTWQHSMDTSSVWAAVESSSSDSAFVQPGAIPWLLLRVVGSQDGPTGGDRLSATTFIQRLSTTGGVVPSSGCRAPKDIGKKAFVPYTADYYFYKASGN